MKCARGNRLELWESNYRGVKLQLNWNIMNNFTIVIGFTAGQNVSRKISENGSYGIGRDKSKMNRWRSKSIFEAILK